MTGAQPVTGVTGAQRGAAGVAAERIRVVIAEAGAGDQDRSVELVARALRDAGMEVVYTGRQQTPEQLVETVVQEDADAVGLSVGPGARPVVFARLVALLRARQADDVLVFASGAVPAADLPELERLGVARVFAPASGTEEIVGWLRRQLGPPAG